MSSTSWNPVELLNPKAAAASPATPQPGIENASSSTSGPSQPSEQITFEFAGPEDVPMEMSTSGGIKNRDMPNRTMPIFKNGLGVQQNLERLHNVQERIMVPPPKRRKTANENDPSVQANSIFFSPSSGILAQHIRDRSEGSSQSAFSPAPSPVPANTIDLTDDLESGSTPSNPNLEEVCYGMIEGAFVKAHQIPAPKPNMVALGGPSWWPQVKVLLKRAPGDTSTTKIYASDCQRRTFGLVDAKTASGLAPLMDMAGNLGTRLDCRIPTRRKVIGEQAGQTVSAQFKIELMIYGYRIYADRVGKMLLRKNINLLSPPRVEPGVKVFNPLAKENRQLPPAARLTNNVQYQAPPMAKSAEEIRSEVLGVFDSLPKSDELPEMDPAPCIMTPLLKHQKQALFFMYSRESEQLPDADSKAPVTSTWKRRTNQHGTTIYYNVVTNQEVVEPPPPTLGGILADMMGLGKTLSILSLLSKTQEDAQAWSQREPVQPTIPQQRPQKSHEVPRAQALPLSDIRRNAKATLLVCPLSTITNWEEQIKQHIEPGKLNYYIYHGANRIKDAMQLARYDLVITTYGSVTSELNARLKRKQGQYPLEEIAWFRIVLDEAHTIREQNTLSFKSICRLQANRRWAVTGTPVQNKLEDLASLLAFLRLKPFDERSKFIQYIITPFKAADPDIVPKLRVLIDTITIRRLKDKIELPERTEEIIRLDFTPEERKVYDIFQKMAQERVQVLTGQGTGQTRIMGGKTMIHVLRSILQLRLICAHGKDLLNDDDFQEIQGMSADAPIDLDSDDDEQKPTLSEKKAYEMFYLMQEGTSDFCIKCNNKIGSIEVDDPESDQKDDILGYMAQCFHVYCPTCITRVHQHGNGELHQNCATCAYALKDQCVELRRSKADVEHETRQTKTRAGKVIPDDRYTGPHTKTRALVQELLANKAKGEANPDEPPYKSVVFSGWTSHLDLLEIALDDAGITHTRLDGKMSRNARNQAMEAFRVDDNVQVILVSIMAGGMGLNLTAGNSVFVMEPQFNPAAEAQAVDRVHRLGQKRPVRIVRYIMNDSFEEKMIALQDKKKKLASLSMDRSEAEGRGSSGDAARQRLQDLRSLFK
ncbi:SNF2 family N-terminal domain-containing protein [Triangularia verruculosa]|uniref:SNF2 family N-terminal domain-containing protein n=1 Tax=Triangularia verruculosa TaxID=2587418 RepID=A0AAN6XNW0_9PEZI|nr:SNF2 family N-terminal domain-containing protein [Triangularia verruculosa]